MERTIIQQVITAIDPKYIKALCNSITNKINASIPAIISHLLDTYGDVTPSELDQLYQQIMEIHFILPNQ
eukprot:3306051-Ditylum_brightwellii.AAC.1